MEWAAGLAVTLSFSGALSAGCGSSGGGGSGGGATCSGDLASIEQTIIKPTCAVTGCHTTAGAPSSGDLDLSGDIASALVNRPSATCPQQTLVVPGSPATSFLHEKIAAEAPSCGARMPIGKALTDAEKACIDQWIAGLTPGSGGGGTGGGGTGGGDAGTDAPSCEQCGGADCVDLTSDPGNCGKCGNACGNGEVCAAGTCASGCGALVQCGNICCPSGATCTGGQCTCPAGAAACNGACIDVTMDANNCGSCGKVCPSGTTCSSGACTCAGGKTLCGSTCVDTQTDASNCGMCGNACVLGQSCNAGACACGSASVSFSGAVQPIFTAKCDGAGCHGGVMPAGALNLSTGQSYGKLVNVLASQCNDGRRRVLPGKPQESYVIQKMLGMNMCFGTKMPKSGMLPSGDIQTVADWICAGAPNN